MRTRTRFALAAGLPVAFLAAGHSVLAATAPTPPPAPPSSDLGVTIPTDFVTLTDDTGTITVGVPGSWTDVYTAPDLGLPFIEASPDREAYYGTFDVPGVMFEAKPYTIDTEAAARDWSWEGVCANERIEPYDDGIFIGSHLVYTECDDVGSQAELHVIAANPANQAFTAMLDIQITGPDDRPILDGILATFNMTSDAVGSSAPSGPVGAPASTVLAPTTSAATGATGGAFPPPSGDVPADWTPLIDLTETITIAVPGTWTATNIAPEGQNDDGTPQPRIWATPDQNLFFPPEGTEDTFSTPGVIYRAHPHEAMTPELLERSVWHDLCTAGPVQSYDDGAFVGYIQSFDSCGGTSSRIVQINANPRTESFSAELIVQLTGAADDAATLDGLLSSFNLISDSTAPTTTAGGAAPTNTVTTSDQLALVQQQFQDQFGWTINDEQGSCVLDSGLDLSTEATALVALMNCGIDILDMAASSDSIAMVQQQVEEQWGVTLTDEQARCFLDSGELDTESEFHAPLFVCGVDVLDIPSG
jgi:hypothetical protein